MMEREGTRGWERMSVTDGDGGRARKGEGVRGSGGEEKEGEMQRAAACGKSSMALEAGCRERVAQLSSPGQRVFIYFKCFFYVGVRGGFPDMPEGSALIRRVYWLFGRKRCLQKVSASGFIELPGLRCEQRHPLDPSSQHTVPQASLAGRGCRMGVIGMCPSLPLPYLQTPISLALSEGKRLQPCAPTSATR